MEPHEPIIRPRRDHCISRRDIDPDALKVLYRLARRGHVAYLVGGGVRDLLLHRTPKDFDVSTSAHPRQIKDLFRNCFLIGRRFRLAHIRYGEKVIETSTFRSPPPPNGDDDLLQRDDNSFGTPEEDAKRRDFTINGLFYCIETFSVIDYVGGLKDLDAQLVRCIGEPEIRFQEDPVRMVRAIRFAARLGFRIEEGAWAAIRTHHEDIQKASPARMTEEIYKLYAYGAAEAAFRLLWRSLLLQDLFPMLHTYLEDAGGDAAPLWRYLAALDQGDTVVQESTQPLMLATLAYHPLLLQHEAKKGKDSQAAWIESVQHVTDRLFASLKIPRWVRDRVRQILSTQYRFLGGKRQRFSKSRLAAQTYFPEALALYEIHLSARGADFLEEAAPWQALFEERMNAMEDGSEIPVDPASDPEGEDEEDLIAASVEEPRRRRSTRRRRRRKKRSDTHPESTEPNEPGTQATPSRSSDSANDKSHAVSSTATTIADAAPRPVPSAAVTGDAANVATEEGQAEEAPKKKRRRRGGRKHKRRTALSTEPGERGTGESSASTPNTTTPPPDVANDPVAEALRDVARHEAASETAASTPPTPDRSTKDAAPVRDTATPKKKRRSRSTKANEERTTTSPVPSSETLAGKPAATDSRVAHKKPQADASASGTAPDAPEASSPSPRSGERKKRRTSKKRNGAHGPNVLRDDRPMQDLTAFDADVAAPHWMDEL